MMNTHYLIVGASHAALAALHAIRLVDGERDVTMVCRADTLPVSPTVLPYIVSGRSDPARVYLKDEAYFRSQRVNFLRGRAVTQLDTANNLAELDDGEAIAYRKLLVASGAKPALPAIEGLTEVEFHVLRTLDDALALRTALPHAKHAVVLGAGLIGMHAAENLVKAKANVTIIEREPQVMPGYFDAQAAGLIESAFAAAGVDVRTGQCVMRAIATGDGCALTFEDDSSLSCDLLLVGTGVVPVTDFLRGSPVALDRGVLVDDAMRTNVPNIWAAGDVAQARGFYGEGKVLNGILPDAVDQGKIAGMAMAEDAALKVYAGAVPLNSYAFFGNQALSVGANASGDGYEVVTRIEPEQRRYLKIVLREDRLAGIFSINVAFDAGIMWELILRRVDLAPIKQRFLDDPRAAARVLMSRSWR